MKEEITNPHHISKKPLEMLCKYLAARENTYQMGRVNNQQATMT